MEPFVLTAQTLRTLGTASATQLLITALDSPHAAIREAAGTALLESPDARGHTELLLRLAAFPTEFYEKVRSATPKLSPVYRRLLLNGSTEQAVRTLHGMRLSEQFEPLSHAVQSLWAGHDRPLDDAAETIRWAVYRLYELREGARESGATALAVAALRHVDALTLALGGALDHWDELSHGDLVVEGLLILGGVNDPTVRKVLWNGAPPVKELAVQALMTGKHPGLMRLVVDSLATNYPHPKAFEALCRRRDPEFVATLLQAVQKKSGGRLHQNLGQVASIDWLAEDPLDLSIVPPVLQAAVLTLTAHARVPVEVRRNVEEWILRHGCPDARVAATSGASTLEETLVQQVVIESLESPDAGIEAWACTQLRSHNIPGAVMLLIDRLQNPALEVREAARRELFPLFNTARLLELYQDLPAAFGPRAGELLFQVDRDAEASLAHELRHPIRHRRIRAALAVDRLHLQGIAMSALIEMVHDPDALVRRTVSEVLGHWPALESRLALEKLATDASPRVRETAAAALKQLD